MSNDAQPKTFSTRPGTIDWGKAYEEITISSLAVSMAKNDRVDDFEISSNNNDYGDFDDIVIKIVQKTHDIGCAMQLKHVENRTTLTQKTLSASKGNFSLFKYFESYKKYCSAFKNMHLIIYTNYKIEVDQMDGCLESKNYIKFRAKRRSDVIPELFDLMKYQGDIYEVFVEQPAGSLTEKELEELQEFQNFCLKLYICPNRPNCGHFMAKIEADIDKTVHRIYHDFVMKWVRLQKKEVLTKTLIRIKMAEVKLAPFVQHYDNHQEKETQRHPVFQAILDRFDLILAEEFTISMLTIFGPKFDEEFFNSKQATTLCKRFNINKGKNSHEQISWHLNEIPMIVHIKPKNKIRVWEGINLCLKGISPEKRKFLLVGKVNIEELPLGDADIYHNLSSFPQIFEHPSFNMFKVSLQGREVVSLRNLIENIKTSEMFTIVHLLKMHEGPINIGENKQILPKVYIEQQLEKILIDVMSLIEKESGTVIINCNGNFDVFAKYFVEKFYSNLTDYLAEESEGIREICNEEISEVTLLYAENQCSDDDFKQIIEKSPGNICHLLNLTSYNKFEWIKSSTQGGFDEMKKHATIKRTFKAEHFAEEMNENYIYLICANAGMGKSVLTQFVKNHYPTEFWVLTLKCRDHLEFFTQEDSTLDGILSRISEDLGYNSLDKNVMLAFMKYKKIVFIWDGVEELPEDFIEKAIGKFTELKHMGFVQWITTRSHLKDRLEKALQVFRWNIRDFGPVQQELYIKRRLGSILNVNQLDDVLEKIYKVVSSQSGNLLGVPLQIYLVTELFLGNTEKYLQLLDKEFTIAKLFSWFIDERFRYFLTNRNDRNSFVTEPEDPNRILYYQLVAVQTYKNEIKMRIGQSESETKIIQNLLAKLKKDGDNFGLVTQVINDDVIFIHDTFREYFVALWLTENHGSSVNFKTFLFEEKNTNIRLFFDTIMAEGRPLHLAVLQGNLKQVAKVIASEHDSPDKGGRNALHLASSWGVRHPILTVEKTEEKNVIDSTIAVYMPHKSQTHIDIFNVLVKSINPFLKDKLFEFTSVQYADMTSCLELLDIMLSAKHTIHLWCLNNFDVGTIVYFSIRFNYPNLFKALKVNTIPCLEDAVDKSNLFHWAAKFEANTETLSRLVPKGIAAKVSGMFAVKQKQINQKTSSGLAPLHIAAQKGNLKVVKFLIDCGADVNIRDKENKHTPLHYAAEEGHLDVIKLLKENGADVNAKDKKNGFTPLQIASDKGNLITLDVLIKIGADINARSKIGSTPLHWASEKADLNTVKFLVEKGAEVNAKNKFGSTPLHGASGKGCLDTITFLIDHGADVNITNDENATPLHSASESGHLDAVIILFSNGPDIKDNINTSSVLHKAADNGHVDLVKFLLQSGANINCKDSKGFSLLHKAAIQNDLNVLQFLVKYDEADVNLKSAHGSAAIHWASKMGHLNIVEFLVTHGADVNVKSNYDSTPLHWTTHLNVVKLLVANGADVNAKDRKNGIAILHKASKEGDLDTVKFLLENGANVNIKDDCGETPLHKASTKGHLHTIRLLVASGAEVDAKDDKSGSTPLHKASEEGYLDAVRFLVENQSDVNVENNYGATPLHCAFNRRHIEIVKFLFEKGTQLSFTKNDDERLLYFDPETEVLDTCNVLCNQNDTVRH